MKNTTRNLIYFVIIVCVFGFGWLSNRYFVPKGNIPQTRQFASVNDSMISDSFRLGLTKPPQTTDLMPAANLDSFLYRIYSYNGKEYLAAYSVSSALGALPDGTPTIPVEYVRFDNDTADVIFVTGSGAQFFAWHILNAVGSSSDSLLVHTWDISSASGQNLVSSKGQLYLMKGAEKTDSLPIARIATIGQSGGPGKPIAIGIVSQTIGN